MEQVERGAKLLDIVRPGWERGVNLRTLDMASSLACILAQVFGDYEKGFEALGFGLFSRRVAFGFTADFTDRNGDFIKLQLEWEHLIGQRLGC